MKIKYKVISATNVNTFEDELEEFLKDKDNYAIQYKPVSTKNKLMDTLFTALISYHTEED